MMVRALYRGVIVAVRRRRGFMATIMAMVAAVMAVEVGRLAITVAIGGGNQ